MMYGLQDAFCSADVRSNFLVDILGALPGQLLLDFLLDTAGCMLLEDQSFT
jgi:hypothetical protein